MSHSNLSSLYNDLRAHAKNMRLTTPRKVLFYTTWARRQRKCMYERIVRDVSLSLNEFTVTPLWYLWNNYKRGLTLPTLVPKKDKRISLWWTVCQQDAKRSNTLSSTESPNWRTGLQTGNAVGANLNFEPKCPVDKPSTTGKLSSRSLTQR